MLHSFRILTTLCYPNELFLPASKSEGLAWLAVIYKKLGNV